MGIREDHKSPNVPKLGLHVAIGYSRARVRASRIPRTHHEYVKENVPPSGSYAWKILIDSTEFLRDVELTFESHHVRKGERLFARTRQAT